MKKKRFPVWAAVLAAEVLILGWVVAAILLINNASLLEGGPSWRIYGDLSATE